MNNSLNTTINNSTNILKEISSALFNTRTIVILIITLIVGTIISRIVTKVLTNISRSVAKQADDATDLTSVNRFRRIETLIILSTALIRVIIVLVSLYFWWSFTHPKEAPTALIGASALIALIASGILSPVLRDVAFGSGMMAEQWFGVGDLITIIPYDENGIVEKISLRSTKIRKLNGDALWVSNQNILAANIISKGVRTLALEFYVNDVERAEELLRRVNCLLPIGPSLLVSPLTIMTKEKTDTDTWHVIALGETTPGREWLIETNAVAIMQDQDSKQKKPILITEPIHRYADNNAEKLFAKAIHNAHKPRNKRRIRIRRNTTAQQPPALINKSLKN
jgi:hypothetical protein